MALGALFQQPLELLAQVGRDVLEQHARAVRSVRSQILVEAHAHDASLERQRVARAERLRDLQRDALARLEGVAREQPAAAARQIGERRAPRQQAGADRDLEADGDPRLAAPLVAGVEAMQQQQAQRLGMHRAPHQVVEADLAQLRAQRGRVFVHHHDARQPVVRGVSLGGHVHGVDAAGSRDQEAGGRRRVARDRAAAPRPCRVVENAWMSSVSPSSSSNTAGRPSQLRKAGRAQRLP
jgi:hypothetical protein